MIRGLRITWDFLFLKGGKVFHGQIQWDDRPGRLVPTLGFAERDIFLSPQRPHWVLLKDSEPYSYISSALDF